MLITYQGIKPNVGRYAFIAETAVLIGDVRIGAYASVWYNSVLRGDLSVIEIGDYSNIQDGTVVHLEKDNPVKVGNYVTVGHGVVLHGCTIEDDCLIGMSATILTGAYIGAGSVIAAGALIPEGKVIPPRSLVMGIPGKVVREITEDEYHIHEHAIHYAEYAREHLTNSEITRKKDK